MAKLVYILRAAPSALIVFPAWCQHVPVARALPVLDRLLEPGHIRADVHVVETGDHDREQDQSAAWGRRWVQVRLGFYGGRRVCGA